MVSGLGRIALLYQDGQRVFQYLVSDSAFITVRYVGIYVLYASCTSLVRGLSIGSQSQGASTD